MHLYASTNRYGSIYPSGRHFGMQSKNALAIPALPLKNGEKDSMVKWGAGMPTMPTMPSDAQ